MSEIQQDGEAPGPEPEKRRWSRWWLLALAIPILLRIALPEIVRRAVESNASAAIRGTVTVGDVDLQLWRGQVDLKDVAVRGESVHDGADTAVPLIAIGRLGLGLRYPPLLRRTVLLREVEVEAPKVALERLASGDLNLLGLLPVTEESTSPGEPAAPSSWKFGLDRFVLSEGRLRFRDALMGADAEPIEFQVGRIAVDDLAISPDVYGGPSRLHAVVALENGNVEVDGTLRMVDGEPALTAKATARALPLRQARIYVPEVGWSNLSGGLDLDLDYELDPGKTNVLRGRAALADVSVAVPGEDVAAALKSFVIELDAVDLIARDAKVKKVELDGAIVSVRLDADDVLPVLTKGTKGAQGAKGALGATPTPAASPPPATTSNAAPAPASPWTWRIEEARVTGSTVRLREGGRPPVDVAIALEAGPLADDAATVSPVKLNLGVANGTVAVDGRLRIGNPAFGGRLAIDGLEIAPLLAIADALPNDVVSSGTLRSDLAIAAGLPARDGEESSPDRLRVAGTLDVSGLRAVPGGAAGFDASVGGLAIAIARLDVPGVIGAPAAAGASIDGDLDVGLTDVGFARKGVAPIAVSAKSLQLGVSSLRVPARLASLAPPDGSGAIEADLALRAATLRTELGGGAATASAKSVEIALADLFVPTSAVEAGGRAGAATAPAASVVSAPGAADTTATAPAAAAAPAAGASNATAPAEPGAAPAPDAVNAPAPAAGAVEPASPAPAADPPAAPGASLDGGSLRRAATPAPILLASWQPPRVIPVAATSARLAPRPPARAPVRSAKRAPVRDAPRPVQRPASRVAAARARPATPASGALAGLPAATSPRLLPPRPASARVAGPANAARFDAKIDIRGFAATTAQGRELRAAAESIVLRLDDVIAPGVVADGAPSVTPEALRAAGLLEITSPSAARGDGSEFSFAAKSISVPATSVAMPGSLGGLPPGASLRPLQVALGDVRLDGPAVRATRTLEGFVLPDVSLTGAPPTRAGADSGKAAAVAPAQGGAAKAGNGARPGVAPSPTPAGDGSPSAAATSLPAPAATPSANAAASRSAAAPAPAPAAPAPAFELQADAIRLTRGRFELVDRTLTPAVETKVFPIELDARQVRLPGPRARPLRLDMTLPGRGRIRIDGELAPGASIIRTNVEGLSLSPFNPYVVASSPYAVAQGALSLASVAREGQGAWTVTNDVTLRQLKLGGTDGGSLFQQNFGIPLETALALLRDVRGDITLGVPFTVDDSGGARVHLGPVVASALRQALMGAIFSPLKMLGALAGGGGGSGGGTGEVPAAIGFAVGNDAPSEEGVAMIDRLAGLLASRPGLAVRLSTAPSEEDARFLREQSLLDAWKSEGPFKRLMSDRGERERITTWLEARRNGETAELSKEDRAAFERVLAERPAPAVVALRTLAEARLASVEEDLRDRGVPADRVVRDPVAASPVAGAPSVTTQLQPVGGAGAQAIAPPASPPPAR